MTAAALLNDLAEALGNDLCKQFVTPEMESLSEVRECVRGQRVVDPGLFYTSDGS